MICRDWLSDAQSKLANAGVESPRFEAELLLAHAAGLTRLDILVSPQREWDSSVLTRADGLVKRRCQREPYSYIVGEREFYGMPFYTPPGVLIPRPETELLVETVLSEIEPSSRGTVADICCGSGCIGVSLAVHRPELKVIAIDIDPLAVQTTRRNAERHGVSDRLRVVESDIATDSSAFAVHWVVANPPYIPRCDISGLQEEVRDYEPLRALDGGEDGMDFYKVISRLSWLKPGTGVAVELGQGQCAAVFELFSEGGFSKLKVFNDLAGIPRVMTASKTGVTSIDCPVT